MEDFLEAGFLSEEEAMSLFAEDPEKEPETEPKNNEETTEEPPQSTEETEPSTEEEPESVGSEETQEQKNTEPESEGSPNTSSIAQAFQEIGVLQTLDDDRIKAIQSYEDLADALEEEVQNRMDEHNKRVDEALKYKMPIPVIQQYENIIKTLDSITEEQLEDESNEDGRKNIIYQDLINKGHSKEEAIELVEDYIASGKDVDKAKKALAACKTFYTTNYEKARAEAKQAYDKQQAATKKQAAELKKSILEDDKVFKDLEISKTMRQKIYEAVSKPVETLEDGTTLTSFQKYVKEKPVDFYKMAGMFFVLTDGFTNIGNLIKGPVKKEMRKGIESLSRVLDNTPRNPDGSMKLKSGVSAEPATIDISKFEFIT